MGARPGRSHRGVSREPEVSGERGLSGGGVWRLVCGVGLDIAWGMGGGVGRGSGEERQ